MHAATMTHLALGSCPSLKVLALQAPMLTHLDLQCVSLACHAFVLAVLSCLDLIVSAHSIFLSRI